MSVGEYDPAKVEISIGTLPAPVAALAPDATIRETMDWLDAKIVEKFCNVLDSVRVSPWIGDTLAAEAKRHTAATVKTHEEIQRLGAAAAQSGNAIAAMAQKAPHVLDPWSGVDESAARDVCRALARRANCYQKPQHIILNGIDLQVSPGAGAEDVWTGYLAAQPGWVVRVDGDGAVCGPCPIRDNRNLEIVLPLVECPRCDGTGEESTFSRRPTCEVCEGEKTIPKPAADAEIAARAEERKRWA